MLGPATCAAAWGTNVNDICEGTGETLSLLLVMFCSCFGRRLKLGASEVFAGGAGAGDSGGGREGGFGASGAAGARGGGHLGGAPGEAGARRLCLREGRGGWWCLLSALLWTTEGMVAYEFRGSRKMWKGRNMVAKVATVAMLTAHLACDVR